MDLSLSKQLADHMIIELKKSKNKFMNIDDVSKRLREKLGDEYTSQIGVEVKSILVSSDDLDFFREDTYIHNNRFYYSVGNFIAVKNFYDTPMEAKDKLRWESWQTSDEIDWELIAE